MARLLKTKLYKLQRKAVSFVNSVSSVAALFMEQGTGKTIVSLATAARMWRRKDVRVVLVVTPKAVVEGWQRQAKQHLNIPHKVYCGPKSLPQATQLINKGRYKGLIFVVLNYEIIWRIAPLLLAINWDLIVADESQRIKSHKSQQSKFIWNLGQGVPYKLILSGTPIDKDEMDLFAQFRFLDDTILGDNYFKFRKVNCKQKGYKWEIRPQSKKRIRKKTGVYSFRVKKSEMLDLPPTFDTEVRFPLTGKALKAYTQMEDGYYTEIDEWVSKSELRVTNTVRLQQLTGGFMATEDGLTVELEQDKLKALLDFTRDIPRKRKIVIFARYREEINILREAMEYQGRTVDVLDGRTADQGKCWTRFQDKPNPSVLILQIRSGGVGIELFVSSLCLLYSVNHSWIDYDQLRARLDRGGQTESVQFVKFIAENTVDEDMYTSLEGKGQTTEEVLVALQKRRRLMSKKEKPAKKAPAKAKAKAKPTPPKFEKPDYGIPELAEALGVDASGARQKLRAAGMEKEGRAWDFKNAKNLKAVVKQLSAGKSEKKAPAKKGKKKSD